MDFDPWLDRLSTTPLVSYSTRPPELQYVKLPETTQQGEAMEERGSFLTRRSPFRGAPSAAGAQRYKRVMRELLQRDYLVRADWSYALRDLAQMAREALDARIALVALLDAGSWSAITDQGERLSGPEISLRASTSVLEQVRETGEPILTVDAVTADSESLQAHRVESLLAVPLRFWNVTEESPGRVFAGALYAHRSATDQPFTEDDVELLADITEVAQRTLSLLRHLQQLESDLLSSREQLQGLQQALASEYRLGSLKTRDPWFAEKVLGVLRRVAVADKVGMLLLGPTGSGKSHLARAYHYESPRRDGPFIVLDCAQVTSEQTLAAELFGYAPRSGFANAPEAGRPGAARLAHGGTLFIDEIATLPLPLQQRLLALVQTGAFSPLGTSRREEADLQVIAATNADLEDRMEQGRFREDLYWRISEVVVELPALSDRAADIPHLAQEFLQTALNRFGKRSPSGFTSEALQELLRHDWARAGNLRGLEHTVSRSVLLAPDGREALGIEDLHFRSGSSRQHRQSAPRESVTPAAPLPIRGSRREDPAVRRVLEQKIQEHQGKISAVAADPEVAAALGYEGRSLPPSTLRGHIQRCGLMPLVERERKNHRHERGGAVPDLDTIRAAILEHRSATKAAKALSISRDALVWQLRRAGLGVRDVLAQGR